MAANDFEWLVSPGRARMDRASPLAQLPLRSVEWSALDIRRLNPHHSYCLSQTLLSDNISSFSWTD